MGNDEFWLEISQRDLLTRKRATGKVSIGRFAANRVAGMKKWRAVGPTKMIGFFEVGPHHECRTRHSHRVRRSHAPWTVQDFNTNQSCEMRARAALMRPPEWNSVSSYFATEDPFDMVQKARNVCVLYETLCEFALA